MSSAVITTTSEREIVHTRVFDAPRELVFAAWTSPSHLAKWWGPNGFSITAHEVDVRPGGHWRFIMHGPDGRDYRNHIVYSEVTFPERIVYRHLPEPQEDTEPVTFESRVTFAALGERTEVTMRGLFPSAQALEYAVKTYGAIEGGRQQLGRLGDHVTRMAALPCLTLTRTFDAPRERVFAAWTDPAHLTRWWGPGQFTNPVCEADARPGGAIRIHMCGPDGTVYPMSGMFHEVTRPERLVFTATPLDAAGNPMFEVLHTVIFDDQNGKTGLTLHARLTMTTPGAQVHLAGMEQGWNQSLDRLARETTGGEVFSHEVMK